MKPMRPIAERFWKKVNRNGPTARPELGPCWVWTAHVDSNGYGRIAWGGRFGGNRLAHRVGFLLTEGRWPKDDLLHRCDNPRCVRPEHLFEGTQTDNNSDMFAKGRNRSGAHKLVGELNARAKLTNVQRNELRQRAARGESYVALGHRFGITRQAARYVVKKGKA